MKKSYGMEFNCSFVANEGEYEIGAHLTDSNGLDVSCTSSGDDVMEVATTAYEEFIEGITGAIDSLNTQEDEADDLEDWAKLDTIKGELANIAKEKSELERKVQELQDELNTLRDAEVAREKKDKTWSNCNVYSDFFDMFFK